LSHQNKETAKQGGDVIDKLNTIILGNNVEILKTFPDKCIDLTVTSPPY
jgi:DNA modification methylase